MSQRSIITSATHWNSRNMLAQKLQHVSQRFVALRTEDLAANPTENLAKILENLGIGHSSLDFLDGDYASLKTSHTVSGNPVRFESQKIKIQPDIQWQKDMAMPQKWLVTLITLPLLVKYGYLRDAHHRGTAA